MTLLGVGAGVVWLAAWFAAAWWVRARAVRIEGSGEPVPQKVHRLQRLLLTAVWLMFAVMVVCGAVGGLLAGAGRHHGHTSTSGAEVALAVAAAVVGVGAPVVFLVIAVRAVRAALARVRDVSLKVPDRRRRVITGVIVGAAYAAVLIVGGLVVPRHGTGHAIGIAAVYGFAVVLLASVIVPLVVVRLRTTAMSDEQRRRLRELAARLDVRVRDFRVLKGRAQKTANAAQIGAIPGLRYIVVTDYLIDHLDARQLDAVVAHELAHARRHHLLIKLGAVLGIWAALEGVAVAVGHATGHHSGGLLLAPLALAVPIGMVLVQGLVGVRLEQSADDLAAHDVGAKTLADALETLADLNDTQRRTGRLWSLLTQHPGIETRLDRLHTMSPDAARAARSATDSTEHRAAPPEPGVETPDAAEAFSAPNRR